MNPEYDTEQAISHLQSAIGAHTIGTDGTSKELHAMKVADYKVIHVSQPPSWRIVKAEDNDDFEEEVFHIHGILCGSDLPPIQTADVSKLRRKATYIRQAARLTGLGEPMFAKAVKKIYEIHDFMGTHIGSNVLNPWQGTTYEGCRAIDANARYFSLRKQVPNERGQPFGWGVDPNGVLAAIRNQHLIHGYDNKVDYLKEEKDKEGKTIRVRTEPRDFKIGDIVYATISFVSFPTKDKGASMNLILRALTLVKSVATFERPQVDAMISIPRANVIKRKIIFEDDKEVRDGIENLNMGNSMHTDDE